MSSCVRPVKATLPFPGTYKNAYAGSGLKSLSVTLSPPLRHISPEHAISGSPGATYKGRILPLNDSNSMRRTASLDALYMRPVPVPAPSTFLQFDKATQTEESFLDRTRGISLSLDTSPVISRHEVITPDQKFDKIIRQRQSGQRRGIWRGGEHSVSSQTLSPIHVKASPVTIPRTCPPVYMRPMRSSVEGLNQEIEKLVLYPGQQACRSEMDVFSRGTPEGHRAPVAEMFHDTRSTQTPVGDNLSSDESQSTSPDEGAVMSSASPRINKFLAREPPDGCEKVSSKLNEADMSSSTTHFKPCVGFLLRPSLGSAFQPLQPIPILKTTHEADDGKNSEATSASKVGE